MRILRSRQTIALVVACALALCTVACGKYGQPRRPDRPAPAGDFAALQEDILS